jgi:hypothetical protein
MGSTFGTHEVTHREPVLPVEQERFSVELVEYVARLLILVGAVGRLTRLGVTVSVGLHTLPFLIGVSRRRFRAASCFLMVLAPRLVSDHAEASPRG